VYKSGFVLPVGTPPITVGANFNGMVRMRRFKQPFEAQLQVMHEAEVASRCNTAQSYVAQRPLLSQLAADAAAAASTPGQVETAKREFDFRAMDAEFNQSAHPDAHRDSPPPPPPSILGTAPRAAPAVAAPH
jgi:hypothetical protein